MKVKDLTLASLLVAFLVAQNYMLYAFPITLTYLVFYLIAKKVKSKQIVFASVIAFVIIKNIVYVALPTTIIFDIIGLTLVLLSCLVKNKIMSYILIIISIIVHILLLDFSTAILTGNIKVAMLINITGGFVAYIYAPLSIIFIVIADGIDVLTKYDEEEK